MKQTRKFATVEEYIARCQPEVRQILTFLRELIVSVVPDAVESISYDMPAYFYRKKPLVYFGAFQKHIGIYGLPVSNPKWDDSIREYRRAKGAIQIPIGKDIPTDMLKELILCRVAELKAG